MSACPGIHPLCELFRRAFSLFMDGCLLVMIAIFIVLLFLALLWPAHYRPRKPFKHSL